jgi:hypothetical protein
MTKRIFVLDKCPLWYYYCIFKLYLFVIPLPAVAHPFHGTSFKKYQISETYQRFKFSIS